MKRALLITIAIASFAGCTRKQAIPAGPAPTTATRFGVPARTATSSVSKHAFGFKAQLARLSENT